MAEADQKPELLRELREHPDKYLPIIDHAWKVFPDRVDGTEWYDDPEYSIGWDVGLLPGNRPCFPECRATCGITMLTYYVSAAGIEEAADADLIRMPGEANLFRIPGPSVPRAEVLKYDVGGDAFFSVSMETGGRDSACVHAGRIFSFRYLNRFNSKKGSLAE